MKKHTLGALLLGLATVGVLGTTTAFADDATTGNSTTADSKQSATTTGNISFSGGTLSLYNVTDSAVLGKEGLKVSDVYTNGIQQASAPLTASVDDFLGDGKDWSLKLAQSGWKAGSDGSAATATTLDTGTLTVTPDKGAKQTLTTAPVEYGKGSTGTVTLPGTLNFDLRAGTAVQTGSYTNTLTWTSDDSVTATANQDKL